MLVSGGRHTGDDIMPRCFASPSASHFVHRYDSADIGWRATCRVLKLVGWRIPEPTLDQNREKDQVAQDGEHGPDGRAKAMRQPRIERGAHRWQRWILPLNH